MGSHWTPFYWRDYIGDTKHLTHEEHGIYVLLMAHYYITERPLPADMATLCRVTGSSRHPRHASQGALQSVLRGLFSLDTTSPSGPVYRHKRIDKELAERERISNRYKARATKGALARWGKVDASRNASSSDSTIRKAMLGDAYPQPQPQEAIETHTSKPSVSDLERGEIVLSVWDYYIAKIGRNPKLYTLTNKRKRMGIARIRDLWPRAAEPKHESVLELMKLCVDKLAASPFHNGKNEQGHKYLDWEILFRSTEQMEKWLNSDEATRQ
jgi:uncharacterized protein YdaU (DUF1376 family)